MKKSVDIKIEEFESKADDDLTTRTYNSASFKGANQNWVYDSEATNEKIRVQREIIVARSRDLDDNHSLATSANDALTHKILAGSGLRIHVECEDEVKRDEITTILEDSFESNQMDFDQLNDFYSIVEMLVRTTIISGECIAVLNWIDDEDADPELLGFNIKILEPEFLDSTKIMAEKTGNIIIDGIEFNDSGQRIAYHLFPVNPDACIKHGKNSIRYDASQIIHCYFQRRAGQLRGIPKAQSSFNTLKLLSDWEDSTAQRQRNTSALSIFIQDSEQGYQSPFINNNNDINDSTSSTAEAAKKLHDVLSQLKAEKNEGVKPKPEIPEIKKEAEEKPEKFFVSNRPGSVSIVPPGKTVKIVEHKGIEGFESFNTHLLHRIAKGWGLSYEALTGDVSKIKFASGRISRLDMADELNHSRRILLKNRIAPKIIKYIRKDLVSKNYDLSNVKLKVTLPQKEVDDRARETKADTDEIRSGLNAPSLIAQARGKTFEDICKTLSKDMKIAEKHGVVFDWMVSKVNKSGAYHNSDLALENQKKEPKDVK